jgi:hypothetical protein
MEWHMKLSVFNLLAKHQKLDEALHAERLRKRPDEFRIRHLKKLKLTIKDRLLRLSGGQRSRVMA